MIRLVFANVLLAFLYMIALPVVLLLEAIDILAYFLWKVFVLLVTDVFCYWVDSFDGILSLVYTSFRILNRERDKCNDQEKL